MGTVQMQRFTQTARNALRNAHEAAVREKSAIINLRHLLIGLAQLPVDESIASQVLNGMGITSELLRQIAESQKGSPSQLSLSEDVQKALEHAIAISLQRGDQVIASAHLLAGLSATPAAANIFEPFGVKKEKLSEALGSLDVWTDEL